MIPKLRLTCLLWQIVWTQDSRLLSAKRKHFSHATKAQLRKKRVLDWPACSPDLSSIKIAGEFWKQRRPRSVWHLKQNCWKNGEGETCWYSSVGILRAWIGATGLSFKLLWLPWPGWLRILISICWYPQQIVLSIVRRNGNFTKWWKLYSFPVFTESHFNPLPIKTSLSNCKNT